MKKIIRFVHNFIVSVSIFFDNFFVSKGKQIEKEIPAEECEKPTTYAGREVLYDPLDGSPLQDPVGLIIHHPAEGRLAFLVNRCNKELYEQNGPLAFASTNRDYRGQTYRVVYPGQRYENCNASNFWWFRDENRGFVFDCNFPESVPGVVPLDKIVAPPER